VVMLSDDIKVYKDNFNSNAHELVGYKGKSTKDSGIIYSPYIKSIFTGTGINELYLYDALV